jgi:hypothetical protein
VKKGLLGDDVSTHDLPAIGQTAMDLVDGLRSRLPQGLGIVVAIDGIAVENQAELDRPLVDGEHVVVMPQTTGEAVLAFVIEVIEYAIVALAVHYLIGLLTPAPKPPGVAQDRGDSASQTYAWDGIKTNYGAGLPVPWVYGKHAVGGQVVWTDVNTTGSGGASSQTDKLRMILSLCEGVVQSVGGKTGEQNVLFNANLPVGLIIDGNLIDAPPGTSLGAIAYTRPGTQDQTPLPMPFSGISAAYELGLDLVTGPKVFTYSDGGNVVGLRVIVVAPSGLYEQGSTGVPQVVFAQVRINVREVGDVSGGVVVSTTDVGAGGPYVGYFVRTLSVDLTQWWPNGITRNFEVTVEKFGFVGPQTVASLVWRDVSVQQPTTLRYPNEALMALELWASARFSGGLPQVQVPVEALLVRVWDAVNGWSPRCWHVPAAPFDFNTHPPGRNPAWCCLDYILSRHGLGEYLTEADVDLPAFRRWAAFCDTDPNPTTPWDEAAFTVDVVGDRPRPAWEWVLTFCAAGRAAPVIRNGKLSVIYQFRDEHGDAGVTVPAKTPTQLLTSGNVENVSMRWLSKLSRPTVYLFQYLNEADLWQQDVLPVEDPEGTMNDATFLDGDSYRPETVQAYGVTRGQQLFREGIWKHRITRLVDRELSFVAGPWTLAAEVGDLIEFEHELLRPFGADDVAVSAMVTHIEDSTNLVIDHDPGTATHIVVRSEDGSSRIATIGMTFPPGVNGWPIILDDPGVTEVQNGAAVVLGVADKLVETYELVSVSLGQDLKRECRAIQWTPTAYDPIEQSEWDDAARGDDAEFRVLDAPADTGDRQATLGTSVQRDWSGHRITWARPRSMQAKTCAVYVRPVGEEVWRPIATTDASTLNWDGFEAHRSYEVSICWPGLDGIHVMPEQGDQTTIIASEFPEWQPPAMTKARAVLLDGAVLVQADELQAPDLDAYELAIGSSWAARRVLARERFPRFHLSIPAGPPILVTAKSKSGLHGLPVVVENPDWSPPNMVAEIDEDDLATSPAGTHDGTEFSGGVLQLQSAVLSGSYVSAEQDAGYQAPFFWQVRWDRRELEDVTVGELDFAVGSGEARWRTIEGRPASSGVPGLDWETTVGDLAMPLSDLPLSLRVGGHIGEVGTHTQVLVESRFYVDGAWTAYREHVDRTVLASRMQVRVTIHRREVVYRATVHLLSYHAFV